jgi:hypothetical protein
MASNAAAGQITISFQGTVTGPGTGVTLPPNVQVGDSISGFFTYTVPRTGTNGTYDFKGTGQTMLFSIPILNNTQTFSDQNSNVAPNNTYTIKITPTGTKGATFDVFTSQINSYGKTTAATCDLLFTSTTYTGTALPTSTGAFTAAFASVTGKFNWDPGGIGVGGDITIINGQAVPEPSGSVLAGIGTAGIALCLIVSRQKKAASFRAPSRVAKPCSS